MEEPAKKTILVVDDEKDVRESVRVFLPSGGFDVIEIENSKKALEFAGHVSVDLLVIDAMLPNMKGRELANRISIMQPNVKVLFLSGYSAETLINHGIFPPGAYSLGKPITGKSFLARVNSILAEGQPWKVISGSQ